MTARSPSAHAPSSAAVRARVVDAYAWQIERQGKPNARLAVPEIQRHCARSPAADRLLSRALSRHALSARGYHRVVKVARTIADLAGSAEIQTAHITEAIAYRRETT